MSRFERKNIQEKLPMLGIEGRSENFKAPDFNDGRPTIVARDSGKKLFQAEDVDCRDSDSVAIFWGLGGILSVAGILIAGALALLSVPYVGTGLLIYLGVVGSLTFFVTHVLFS